MWSDFTAAKASVQLVADRVSKGVDSVLIRRRVGSVPRAEAPQIDEGSAGHIERAPRLPPDLLRPAHELGEHGRH